MNPTTRSATASSLLGRPSARALREARRLVESYFEQRGWRPFRFQQQVWKAYAAGSNGLLHSATGTGKTLAVWLAPIIDWIARHPPSSWNVKQPPGLKVMWITPLRALAADTEQALRSPLEALGLPWRLESRTGDSRASVKARQLKQLPSAIVTTPESISILLTHAKLLEQLSALECVIVDEWHELLGSKRGVQTELVLARLRQLNPNLRVWGLSATLGNLEQACDVLMGRSSTLPESDATREPRAKTVMVEGVRNKKLKMHSLLPKKIERFPWSGHIGTLMVPQVAELLEQAASALVFTNTRSQTEIWYQKLLQHRPDWAGTIALHHGSLDSSVREWVEQGLRDGKLRAVVCTSSLDLGVDFTAVDMIVQVGSPKGAARLLQRAGRSGHQPEARSNLAFVPTHALELIELAAARTSIDNGVLEARQPLENALDVLVQHVVTVAIGGGFASAELLREIRTAHAFRSLTDAQWQWVLDFGVRGGSSLTAYPDFQRVAFDGERYSVDNPRIARLHRMNIGTIASDMAMQVKYLSGKPLGTVEESYLSKIKPGEKFMFAGRVVEMVRMREGAAYVRRSSSKPESVPRWMGGRMPLSSELSAAMRTKLAQVGEGIATDPEIKVLLPLFAVQERWSHLPAEDELLIEQVKTREGHQLFVYPFEGRLVHEGLAALLAFRLSKREPITLSMACNDYGLVMQSHKEIGIERAIAAGLLSAENLEQDILASMNATEMAMRQFRQIARVAGLIHGGYPGEKKKASHLQASSNMFYEVFERYDPGNLLLLQSRSEVLEQQLELSRLRTALDRIASSRIVVTQPKSVTPLAFPIYVDKLRERISSESLVERIRRLQQQLEKAADEP